MNEEYASMSLRDLVPEGQDERAVSGTGEPMGQITRPQPTDPTVSARSAALGDTITAGSSRFYMVGYRDKDARLAGHCGSSLSTKNSTQGVEVAWGP